MRGLAAREWRWKGGEPEIADPRRETAGAPPEDVPQWRRVTYLTGRIGVWFIPVLGALGVLGVMSTSAFSEDPQRYAEFLANRWTSPMSVALTVATVVVACFAALALGVLLLPMRGRWFAIPGAVLATAGAIMMGVSAGSTIVRAPGAAHGALHGRFHDFSLNPDVHGTTAGVLTLGGAALLTLGWMVLGVAVIRAPRLSIGDGAFLIVAAPIVFLGGFFLHTVPTIGAFLLVGAGLGIASTAGRLSPDRGTEIMPPRVARSDLDIATLFPTFAEPGRATDGAAANPDLRGLAPELDDLRRMYDSKQSDVVQVPDVVRHQNAEQHQDADAVQHQNAVQHQEAAPEQVPVHMTSVVHDRDRGSRFSRGMASAWQVNRRSTSATTRGRKARNAKAARPGPHPPGTDSTST